MNNKRRVRKEYKEKCKIEKSASYKFSLIGGIVACIGFAIVIINLIFNTDSDSQIFLYILAGIIALVGIILDVMGEIIFYKNLKKYLEE